MYPESPACSNCIRGTVDEVDVVCLLQKWQGPTYVVGSSRFITCVLLTKVITSEKDTHREAKQMVLKHRMRVGVEKG